MQNMNDTFPEEFTERYIFLDCFGFQFGLNAFILTDDVVHTPFIAKKDGLDHFLGFCTFRIVGVLFWFDLSVQIILSLA